MIREHRINKKLLDAWLVDQKVVSNHDSYHLKVFRANSSAFDGLKKEMRSYITESLEDARKRLRRGFEDDLSPFTKPADDPAANFPQLLNIVTLKGYWGETLAAISVECWGALGHQDWQVPAMLFRFHDQEFQHLEGINQRILENEAFEPDDVSERRIGRTGDDALAFRLNDQNVITDVIAFESKCLTKSNTAKIKEAHEKLAAGLALPSGVHELINLLAEYDTAEATRWRHALLAHWRGGFKKQCRFDGLVYACGQVPKGKGRISWLDVDAPHVEYRIDRSLVAFEFQIPNLNELVISLYR